MSTHQRIRRRMAEKEAEQKRLDQDRRQNDREAHNEPPSDDHSGATAEEPPDDASAAPPEEPEAPASMKTGVRRKRKDAGSEGTDDDEPNS